MSTQQFLVLRKNLSSSFHFRSIVPKDLQNHFGQREFHISLKSSSLRYSKSLSMRLYGITQRLYEQVRSGEMKELTVTDIKEILRVEVRKSILHVHHVEEGTNLFVESKILQSVTKISEQEEKFNQRLQTDLKSVQKDVERDLEKILLSQGYDVIKESVPFKRLRRWVIDLRKMRYQWKKDILLDRDKSEEEWDNEFLRQVEKTFKLGLDVPSESSPPSQPVKVVNDDSDTIPLVDENHRVISELIEEYLSERRTLLENGKVRNKTIEGDETSLTLFMEIIGDRRVSELNQKHGRDFRETLRKLPPRRKTHDNYKFKSTQEIVDMKLPSSKTMSPRTINQNYIQKCSSWMKWCIDLGYYEGENIFRGKTVKGETNISVDEKQFNDNELSQIFDPKNYLDETINRGSHIRFPVYWIPILGLFTGCRLNELCQLHVSDVKPVDKLWCLDINSDSPDKSIKNPTSRRVIPLSQTLIDLGFIKYVQSLENKGTKRIFPELTLGKNGYSRNISRFFNVKYLSEKLGLKKKGKNFHSFRHSLTNHLKQKGINENYVDELTGHKWNTMTFGTYSQKYEPKVLMKECVSKIDFKLDFESLKVSDWEEMLKRPIQKRGVTTRTSEIDTLVKVLRGKKDNKGNPMSLRKISEVLNKEYGFKVSHDTVRRILSRL